MPVRATPPAPETPSVWKRLGWMLLIWSASVAALGALSLILRLWLKP